MLFEDLQTKFIEQLDLYHVIETPGEERKVKIGDIPLIQVEELRKKKSFYTNSCRSTLSEQ